jgi:hypothetical protein
MALRWTESWDDYTSTTAFDAKWGAGDHNGAPTPASGGRFGRGLVGWTNNGYFGKVLDAQPTWVVGMALKLAGSPGGDSALIALYDSGTLQCDLRINSSRRLLLTRNGTTLGTGTTVLPIGAWVYIEMKYTIDNSSGVASCRINGVSELNLTSQDTQTTANATADMFRFFGGVLSFTVDVDDIYACDGTGGVNDNYLGDVRIEAIYPSGNGNSSQLVGSDANSTDNYLLVDETDPNGDTDYVESSNVGDKDTYAFGNLASTSGTVYGVHIQPYARKTDAGTRKIVSVARLSGTETDSADKVLSTSYQYLTDCRDTKPGGGSWSISDVNNSEFGVKISA